VVTVVAELTAQAGKDAEVKQELIAMVEATRLEEGCVQYDLHVSTEQPGTFLFYENWTSREALERHSASLHLQAFAAKAPGLLAQPARVLTYTRIA
jgi:quinol monooxygenase YgiN